MNYKQKLVTSSNVTGNLLCFGIDPVPEALPEELTVVEFFESLLDEGKKRDLLPSAFKLNFAHFLALNDYENLKPYGFNCLSSLIRILRQEFKEIPIIIDAKVGDIPRTTSNYARIFFSDLGVDAITLSPYLGSDVLIPFQKYLHSTKGGYLLVYTTNPSAKELQQLNVNGKPLYLYVAQLLSRISKTGQCVGAVLSALEQDVIIKVASQNSDIPLLIPGVGTQGGEPKEVINSLVNADYQLCLARLNCSSYLTHPWYKNRQKPGRNWLEKCIGNLEEMINQTRI